MRRSARNISLLSLSLLTLSTSGCGFRSKGPPAGHESMTSFSCTDNDVGPIADLAVAGSSIFAILIIASNPDQYENHTPVIAIGLPLAAIAGASAFSGVSKVRNCREAKRLLAIRQARAAAEAREPAVRAVAVSPDAHTLAIGERVQLTASARGSGGAVLPGHEFTWWSSDPRIASVDGVGLVTGIKAGTVTVGASTGLVPSGTARIVVLQER